MVAPAIELLPGGAALLTDENVLVVADMHLGAEATLEYEGLSIPRVQTRKIEEYLLDTIESVSQSKVIVASDLKHNFSRNLIQEWQDVTRFITCLAGRTKLEVIKGNHDNYLGAILRDHGIPLKREVTVSGIRVLHGHSGVLNNQPTVMGHVHPSLKLRDSAGASFKDRCFLFDAERSIVVLPALSLVAYGTDVVRQLSSDTVSPLLSEHGLSSFEPVMFSKKKALRFPTVGELRQSNGAG